MMATFTEVMKQWKRMCVGTNCEECPICLAGCSKTLCYEGSLLGFKDVEEIEKIIILWSAENPEMVYPSWGEWLRTTAFLKTRVAENGMERIRFCWDDPIPADIAKKLGIQPKEAR